MIVELLGTGNDSKQPTEKTVNSRDIIPENGILHMIQEYVYTPPNPENDEKDGSGFTLY